MSQSWHHCCCMSPTGSSPGMVYQWDVSFLLDIRFARTISAAERSNSNGKRRLKAKRKTYHWQELEAAKGVQTQTSHRWNIGRNERWISAPLYCMREAMLVARVLYKGRIEANTVIYQHIQVFIAFHYCKTVYKQEDTYLMQSGFLNVSDSGKTPQEW